MKIIEDLIPDIKLLFTMPEYTIMSNLTFIESQMVNLYNTFDERKDNIEIGSYNFHPQYKHHYLEISLKKDNFDNYVFSITYTIFKDENIQDDFFYPYQYKDQPYSEKINCIVKIRDWSELENKDSYRRTFQYSTEHSKDLYLVRSVEIFDNINLSSLNIQVKKIRNKSHNEAIHFTFPKLIKFEDLTVEYLKENLSSIDFLEGKNKLGQYLPSYVRFKKGKLHYKSYSRYEKLPFYYPEFIHYYLNEDDEDESSPIEKRLGFAFNEKSDVEFNQMMVELGDDRFINPISFFTSPYLNEESQKIKDFCLLMFYKE